MISLCQKNCFCTSIKLYKLRLNSCFLNSIQILSQNTNSRTDSDSNIDPDNMTRVGINSSINLYSVQLHFKIVINKSQIVWTGHNICPLMMLYITDTMLDSIRSNRMIDGKKAIPTIVSLSMLLKNCTTHRAIIKPLL
jgi:hypothetical protein